MNYSRFLERRFSLIILAMFFSAGCLATQDWVKTYVPEQLFPVNKRISDTEANVTQMGGRVSNVEGQVQTMSKQIADLDSRLNQTTAKADQAKKDIDSFLSDLSGEAEGAGRLLYVVAGYTDNVGTEKVNYDLARLRADRVASYLTTDKKIDPASLSVISMGESSPVASNGTEAGRAKNRRVEILVYRDSIGVGSGVASPQAAKTAGRSTTP